MKYWISLRGTDIDPDVEFEWPTLCVSDLENDVDWPYLEFRTRRELDRFISSLQIAADGLWSPETIQLRRKLRRRERERRRRLEKQAAAQQAEREAEEMQERERIWKTYVEPMCCHEVFCNLDTPTYHPVLGKLRPGVSYLTTDTYRRAVCLDSAIGAGYLVLLQTPMPWAVR